MKVALYARVSTQRQAQTQNINQQLERLQTYVQAQGWSIACEDIFRDDGYSGATLKRPGLDRRVIGLPRVSWIGSSSPTPIDWLAITSIKCCW